MSDFYEPGPEAVVLNYRVPPTMAAEAAAEFSRHLSGPFRKRWVNIGLFFVLGLFYVGVPITLQHYTGIDALPIMLTAALSLLVALWVVSAIQKATLRGVAHTHLARAQWWVELGPLGVKTATDHSHGRYGWQTIDAVLDLSDGLLIAMGGGSLPIPDKALPRGLDRAELTARIARWRAAAGDTTP